MTSFHGSWVMRWVRESLVSNNTSKILSDPVSMSTKWSRDSTEVLLCGFTEELGSSSSMWWCETTRMVGILSYFVVEVVL